MRGFLASVRYSIRLLLKSPGFTITAVLILGFGIGANTAIFSLINSVLLKPLPYPRSERLVEVFQPLRNIQKFYVCYPDYQDFLASQRSFEDLALTYSDDVILTGQGDAAHLSADFVTGNYFRTLGRPLLFGRPFGPEEDRPDVAPIVILGEHLWRSRFHADPKMIGARVILNGASYEVVGIAPQRVDETANLYLPLNLEPALTRLRTDRANHSFQCIGRLKDGITVQQALADLTITSEDLRRRFPDTHATVTVRVAPFLDSVVSDFSSTLWLMGACATLLLIIACANVAGLHLARGLERQREMTIRASLGASKSRLIRQLMTETMVLTLAGGVIGAVVAGWGIGLIRALAPPGVPRLDEVGFDNSAFILVLTLTLVIALIAGLFPAFAISKTDLTTALRSEGNFGGTGSRQRQWTQYALIICQVAVASLLLFGCVLLARSLETLQQVPLGFNARNLFTTDVYLTTTKYPGLVQWSGFFDALVEKLRQLPGVTTVCTTDVSPFSMEDSQFFAGPFGIVGQADPDRGHRPRATMQVVSPDYFRAFEIPILRGRAFAASDQPDKDHVVIINQALAETYFPGQDPLGKQIHDFAEIMGGSRSNYTIVGVVPTVYQVNPAQQSVSFQTYFPYTQPPPYRQEENFCTLAVRTDGNPALLKPAVQKIVAGMDSDVPVSNSGVLEDVVAKSFQTRQLALLVLGLFSGSALILAVVGVYAVLARLVRLRTREIGVRVALGAQVMDVMRIVFWQGTKIVCVGLMLGIVAALILGRFLSSLLFGIATYDPMTLGLVIVALALTAIVACLVPTIRAIRINPVTALRE
jgi:putative ABC transport system permease protein